MFSRRWKNRTRLRLKRWLGMQTIKELREEFEEIEQLRYMKDLNRFIGRWNKLKIWWKYRFLHSLGLHQSLIESIHEGIGPGEKCSRCGGSMAFVGMEYGVTSDEDYLDFECPLCDRDEE